MRRLAQDGRRSGVECGDAWTPRSAGRRRGRSGPPRWPPGTRQRAASGPGCAPRPRPKERHASVEGSSGRSLRSRRGPCGSYSVTRGPLPTNHSSGSRSPPAGFETSSGECHPGRFPNCCPPRKVERRTRHAPQALVIAVMRFRSLMADQPPSVRPLPYSRELVGTRHGAGHGRAAGERGAATRTRREHEAGGQGGWGTPSAQLLRVARRRQRPHHLGAAVVPVTSRPADTNPWACRMPSCCSYKPWTPAPRSPCWDRAAGRPFEAR